MIDGNVSENAERSRAGVHGIYSAGEHTLGEFAAKLRATANQVLEARDDVPQHLRMKIAGELQTAATLIENMRPAAAWMKRQPEYDGDGVSNGYTLAQVVDLLERFAEQCDQEKRTC